MKIDHPTLRQIPALRRLWQEAFGDEDAFLDRFFSVAFDSQRCLCAMDGDAAAAAAYWFRCGEYAYIYAVATAKKYRGRGLCHTLMARIHALLEHQGYAGTIIVPGEETLRTFYRGMGYENFGGSNTFSCTAGETTAPLRKIGPEEYAKLRRNLLPQGGVIQEGENLAFLAAFYDFYAGDDFLLAAVRDGKTLQCPELLGNAAAASGILSALGAQDGFFCTPGQTPFAMCRPLNEKKPPAYFGLAFD